MRTNDPARSRAEPLRPTRQWEYKRVAVDESYLDERELDQFGFDGWELIGWRHEPPDLSSEHDQDANSDQTTGVQTIYVFKRARSASRRAGTAGVDPLPPAGRGAPERPGEDGHG